MSIYKIYKISQDVNEEYDTYDSAVVIAKSEEDAKLIYPAGGRMIIDEDNQVSAPIGYNAELYWAHPRNVKVELIGISNINEERVVVASFNAG